MSDMSVTCRDDRRRGEVRATDRLNGIDYVEVEAPGAAGATPVLRAWLLRPLPKEDPVTLFVLDDIVIEGGPGSAPVHATALDFERAAGIDRDDVARITLDGAGDCSTYTLRLARLEGDPPTDIDPRYRSATFRFIDDTIDIDCVQPALCPPEPDTKPELNYLAKDYASFRQVLLDRLAATLPDWRERHSPDLYLTLVEILAYEADHLSYAQDAVATEAYLDTARLRTSVRRHARLVDYAMHEGCNARAWVCLTVRGHPRVAMDTVSFLTRPEGIGIDNTVVLPDDLRRAPRASYEVFEPMLDDPWPMVTPHDIEEPEELARRLRDAGDEVMEYLKSRLPEAQRALLEQDDRSPGERAKLVEAIASLFNDELHDARLAMIQEDATGHANRRYGTPNALQGERLCRHNRCMIEGAFPSEVARPARRRFHEAHNTMHFHTWSFTECCLPKGATSATLRDGWEDPEPVRDPKQEEHQEPGQEPTTKSGKRLLRYLQSGEVLIFEEKVNPGTGNSADVDPSHRHAVRLRRVEPLMDELTGTPVVEIAWDAADALPFPLVLSAIGPAPECALLDHVSVAHGNVVLVDHGETVREPDPARLRDDIRIWVAVPFPEPHDVVPAGEIELCCVGEGQLGEYPGQPARYEPVLERAPLVFSEPLASSLPASKVLARRPERARPQVALFSPLDLPHPRLDVVERLPDTTMPRPGRLFYERWRPRLDLLASDADDRHVVVEVDDWGMAHIRFGDGQLGARPTPGARFLAWYRTGGGKVGNVGGEAIRHVALGDAPRDGEIVGVRNPIPAGGGLDREPVAEVRLKAPHAFRARLERAITTEDYAAIVLRDFADEVQRAAASVATEDDRTKVTVYIDRLGGEADDPDLRARIAAHLERYRRIGHEIEVVQARYVSVTLKITAGMLSHHRRGTVLAALRDRFSNRVLADGSRGFFHPDALTFGQGLPVSAIVAAAHRIPGVAWAEVTTLEGLDTSVVPPEKVPLKNDVLKLGPIQIARLENHPDRPGHGTLDIELEVTP